MFTQDKELYFAYIAAVLVFVVMAIFIALFIILHKQKIKWARIEHNLLKASHEQQILQSQNEIKEVLMSSLSKELHDNVCQLLGSSKMLLGVTLRNNTLSETETVKLADETIGKAIDEIRTLSKSLSSEWLQQFDFIENIKQEVGRINATNQLSVIFTYSASIILKEDKQIILFRIVQEALQNVLKHAQAKNVQLSVGMDSEYIRLVVSDDGIGFNYNDQTKGLGTLNINQRVKLLGGIVQWDSIHNLGTTITIQIPIENVIGINVIE